MSAVETLLIDRPSAGNAFDIDASRAAVARLEALEAEPDCRVVVVRAEGPLFSAGGDVAAMAAAADPAEYLDELVGEFGRVTSLLSRTRLGVVSVIQGAVAGAGMLFPLLSDVVIATPAARFVSAYAGVGLSPDCGVSYLLPRAIGQKRALRFSLFGEKLDAQTALDWGIVDEIVSVEEVDARVEAVAQQLQKAAPQSVAPARRLLRDVEELDAHAERERAQIVELARNPDTVERLRRFASR